MPASAFAYVAWFPFSFGFGSFFGHPNTTLVFTFGFTSRASTPCSGVTVAAPSVAEASPAPRVTSFFTDFGATVPSGASARVRSILRHWPLSSLNRVGAAVAFVVIVPSGFVNVCDVSVRSDSTSTGLPCARAEIAADVSSGRDDTFEGLFGSPVAGFAGVAAATGAASIENVIPTRAHNAHANQRHTPLTRSRSRKKNMAPRGDDTKDPRGENRHERPDEQSSLYGTPRHLYAA